MKNYINYINSEIYKLKCNIKNEAANSILEAKNDRDIEKIKLAELFYESSLNRCLTVSKEIFNATNEIDSLFDEVASNDFKIDDEVDLEGFDLDVNVKPVSTELFFDKLNIKEDVQKHRDKVNDSIKGKSEDSINVENSPIYGNVDVEVKPVSEVDLDGDDIKNSQSSHADIRKKFIEQLKQEAHHTRMNPESIDIDEDFDLEVNVKPITPDEGDIDLDTNPEIDVEVKPVSLGLDGVEMDINPGIDVEVKPVSEALADDSVEMEENPAIDVEVKPVSEALADDGVEMEENPAIDVEVKPVSEALADDSVEMEENPTIDVEVKPVSEALVEDGVEMEENPAIDVEVKPVEKSFVEEPGKDILDILKSFE